ncbi:MAG: fumarate hydratase class II [Candidatus Micrarchaeota archaeon]|nr:MAG: fumarate hydratase class II [Candidatus Micrarchaeota archaeon]
MDNYRIENDALGAVKVPKDAYYGSETQRALDNFKISNIKVSKRFIYYYALLKKAAAMANHDAGRLDDERFNYIIKAIGLILKGRYEDQFNLDIFQAGAGTNTNMNLNEVIANIALELANKSKGDYSYIHPNDHVNMSQSTNDTYHTAIHIAAYMESEALAKALEALIESIRKKEEEFKDIIKLGRTHLQDAVPLRLSQELSGFEGSLRYALDRLSYSREHLLYIPIGGTAVGTGINTSKDYKKNFIKHINDLTGARFKEAEFIFAQMSNLLEDLDMADALDVIATSLNKIANDIRLLNSGPRGGIAELIIPEVQPGSSIMPGKVNPSIAEMLNMVCYQIFGIRSTVHYAANNAQLQLDVFMPIVSFNLLFGIEILKNAALTFKDKLIEGMKPNLVNIKKHLDEDLSIATALSPYIGYAKAAEIARKAYLENKSVKQVCLEEHIMDEKKLDEILDPSKHV